MWGMDWLDSEGAARQKLLEQQQSTDKNQKESTPGKPLPQNKSKPGGGALYSAATTPEGRVHTEQIIKKESKGSPLADIAGDVLEQKQYNGDRDSESFQRAPTIEQAFGIDDATDKWGGWKGKGMQIAGGLASGIAPVIAGGLMGGREGAMKGWERSRDERQENALQEKKQLFDVSSDKTMREAYEIARMNYESDYSNGKADLPFGDYLAQAMEAMGTNYSGSLGTLIDIYGPDEGYRRYQALRARSGSGGGGSGGVTRTISYQDPTTGAWVTDKVKGAPAADPSGIAPRTTYTNAPPGETFRIQGRPPLSSFNK